MNWRIIAIVFLVIGMVGKPVRAAGEPRWYVGIGVGSSDVDNGDFDDDRGMKAFVGYGLSETFALEGGFID
ncbi:MAG: outer membrane beta-barrel protein, partial [Acidiferrobacterales bacterium]